MPDITSLRDTIIPKSDQLNAEQLLAGPITITVTDVRRTNDDQPIAIDYEGDNGRPYKPCKSMRKVLIFAWGEDGTRWVGRKMTLFNDPAVKWGGVAVGGVRISHMSDIERDIKLALTATKGKKEPFTIKRLDLSADPDAQARQRVEAASLTGTEALQAAWSGLTKAQRTKFGTAFIEQQKARAAQADKARQQGAEQQPANDPLAAINAAAEVQQPPAASAPPHDDEGF